MAPSAFHTGGAAAASEHWHPLKVLKCCFGSDISHNAIFSLRPYSKDSTLFYSIRGFKAIQVYFQ